MWTMNEYAEALERREQRASEGGRQYKVTGLYGEKVVTAHNQKEARYVARMPRILKVERI